MFENDLLDSFVIDNSTKEYRRQILTARNNLTEFEIVESAKNILLESDSELPEEIMARRKMANNLIQDIIKIINSE